MAGTRQSTVEVTVVLRSEENEFLETQASAEGISVNDLMRRSIILEKFFVNQKKKRQKFFFGVPGRPLREVVRE